MENASLEAVEPSPYDDPCYYEQPPMTDSRFWLVSVFGSTVALISTVENVLLFYLFFSRRHHRTSHNMYLMLLSFFDVFVSISYVCLMSVNVLSDYLISPFLVKLWFSYMVPMLTISHIGMTSSSFLIVAASFERYCLTTNSRKLKFAQKRRKLIAAGAILLGIVSKGTLCMEFKIMDHAECAGTMLEVQMQYRDFVFDTPYNVVWRFWYRNFVTVFAPFLILAFLNIRIVRTLTKRRQQLTVCADSGEASQTKRNARAATRTLVMVVCCYLISNIINVVLVCWEHIDKDSLIGEFISFYAIAVDCVSLLTTMACAFRLPIYMTCQVTLREEVFALLRQIFGCNRLSNDKKWLAKEDSVSLDPSLNTKIVSTQQVEESVAVDDGSVKLFYPAASETLL